MPWVRNSTALLSLVQIQWQRRNLFANYLYCNSSHVVFCLLFYNHPFPSKIRVVGAVGRGGGTPPHLPLQFLANQLTLSQPGRWIMPQTLLRAPPDFETFPRPCKWTQEHESSIWLYQVISFFLVCSWENRFPWEWWITFAAKLILYKRIFGTWQVQFLVNQAI
jgi:hypothetical protein